MATIVELVRTPGVLHDCVWYRVACPGCGEYEICLAAGSLLPQRCHYCRSALALIAACLGRTARLLPEVSKPLAGIRVLGNKLQKKKGRSGGRKPKESHEPAVKL